MRKIVCGLLILSTLLSFASPSFANEAEEAWFGTLAVEYSDNVGSVEQLNVMVKDGFVYVNGEELARRLGYHPSYEDTGLGIDSSGDLFEDAAPYQWVYFTVDSTTVDYQCFPNAVREYTAPAPCVKNAQGIWIPLRYSLLLLGGDCNLLGDTLVIQMPRQNAMSIANIIYFNGNILSFDWEDDFGYSESTSKRTDGASRTITLLNGLLTFDGTAWLSVVDWDAFDRKFGHTLTGMICTESQEEFRASLEEVETLLDVFSPTGKAGELLRDMQGDIDLDASSWKIVCDRYLKLLEEGSGSTSEYNKLYQQYESAMDEQALFAALGGEGAIHIQNQLSAATDVLDKLANIGNAVTYFNEFQQKDVFAMSVLDNYLNTRRSTNYLPDATAQAMHSRLNVMKKDGLLYSGYRFLQDNWLEKAVDFTQIDKLLGGPANVALFAWDIMSSTVPFYSDGLKSVEKREISNYAQKLQNDAWSNLFDMLTRLKTEARQPSKKECAELAEYCYVYLKSCYIARSAAIDSLDMDDRSDEFKEKIKGKLAIATAINKKIAQYLAVLSRVSENSGYDVLGGLPERNEDFFRAASDDDLISVIFPAETAGETKQLSEVVVTKAGQVTRNITLSYDKNGRIQEVIDQYLDEAGEPDSITVERYIYDSRGNLIRQEKETPHHTFVDEYIYDDAGKLISSTDQEIGGWSNNTYEYDSEGRLIRTTEESETSTLVTEYVYNSEGVLIEAKLTRDEYGRVSVHKRTYEYDSAQNLIKMVTTGPDGTEVETYEYDSQDRQIKIVLESSSGTTYRTFDYSCKPFVVCQYNGVDVALRLDNWFLDMGNAELYSDEDGYLTKAEVSAGGRTYTFYYEGDMISSDDATQNNGTEELVSDAFRDYGIRNDGGVNNYRIPKLNISGDAAEKTNAAIYKDLYDGVYQKIGNRSGQCGSSGMTYSWTESNGIVSILARWSPEDYTGHGPVYYKAYNASSETGATISLEQLTQVYGLSVDEFYAQAKKKAEALFDQINGSLANADWTKSYYAEYKADMLSDKNIRNAIPFISESGDLCIIVDVYYVGTMVHGEGPINLTGDTAPKVPEFSWVKPEEEPEDTLSDMPQNLGITGEYFIGTLTESDAGAVSISTPQELAEKLTANPAGSYVLACDIDLGTYNGGVWVALDNFSGVLDGQGHVIRNLKVTSYTDAGLFLNVEDAVFKDLGIEAIEVSASECAGVVSATGNATFVNCYAICPKVCAEEAMGGLIGLDYEDTTKLQHVYVDVSMSANPKAYYDSAFGEYTVYCYAGGIVGCGTVDASDIVVNCDISIIGEGKPTSGEIVVGGVLGNSDEARKISIVDADVNCSVYVKTARFISWKTTSSGRRSYDNVQVVAGGLIGEDTHSYGSGNFEYSNKVTISGCTLSVNLNLDVYGVAIAGGFIGNEYGLNKSGMVVTIENCSLTGTIHAVCNDGSYAKAGGVFGYHPKNMSGKNTVEIIGTSVQCQVKSKGGYYFTYGGAVSGDGTTSIALENCSVDVDLNVIPGNGDVYIDGERQ